MTDPERKSIHIPEICRVEGHSAVHVDIVHGKVEKVTLDVFEGTRFFERIVRGHHFTEIPHITSRVCAICSTGHVLAAAFAVERALGYESPAVITQLRELMHLGMIIESHATHIYALALPDYVGAGDLLELATEHPNEFKAWTTLRNLGASVQTVVGGRPFHPVNLHAGGLSSIPARQALLDLLVKLEEGAVLAADTCELLLTLKPPVSRTTTPVFLALVPSSDQYGYFGDRVQSTDGWSEGIESYREYLGEVTVGHSHAKRSSARGKPLMVGSMARLAMFSDRLGQPARSFFRQSALAAGDTNSLWNNLAQAIEIVEAVDRAKAIIAGLVGGDLMNGIDPMTRLTPRAGAATWAVECPRGTLYHHYDLDDRGRILAADMITPSAQNTHRIELDIREVVDQSAEPTAPELQGHLETLIRAYDPCNTCATHMVSISYG